MSLQLSEPRVTELGGRSTMWGNMSLGSKYLNDLDGLPCWLRQ